MKNCKLLFITVVSVFSFSNFAQKTKAPLVDKKKDGIQIKSNTLTKKIPTPSKTVKYYHVKEHINMTFGSYTTTYDVSDSSQVRTNDLGPNNTRVVTPRFAKEGQLPNYLTKTVTETLQVLNPKDLKIANPSIEYDTDKYAYIIAIKTYERVADKGYKSVDMFQKLGNYYYYKNELDKAIKWYTELFAMTSDLEPVYYYQYAKSLRFIGQNDKADEILEKFKERSEMIAQKEFQKQR